MNAQSTGTISLRSCNPLDMPLIDPNYLDNPYDLEAFTAAIRFERKLMATEIMQRHYKEPICAPTSDSDEDIQVRGVISHRVVVLLTFVFKGIHPSYSWTSMAYINNREDGKAI